MSSNTYHQERSQVPPPPSGCPLQRTWSPLNAGYLADPHPIATLARRLRSREPADGQETDYFPNITFAAPPSCM